MDEMKRLIIGDEDFEVVDGAGRIRLDGHDAALAEKDNLIKSLSKKILAMTGTLKELNKAVNAAATVGTYSVTSIHETTDDNDNVTEKYMNIGIGDPINYLSIDLLESDLTNFGTIKRLRGYSPTYRNRLYLLNAAHWVADENTAEAKFYFDGVEKTVDQIAVDDTFTSLVIFKRMDSGKVYIHEIDAAGIKLFIMSDVVDFQKSVIYTGTTTHWKVLYDGEEVTIYALNQNGKTLTIRSDTKWTQNEWFKAEIHW